MAEVIVATCALPAAVSALGELVKDLSRQHGRGLSMRQRGEVLEIYKTVPDKERSPVVDWATGMKCLTPDGPGVIWQRFETTCEVHVLGEGLGIYAFDVLTAVTPEPASPSAATRLVQRFASMSLKAQEVACDMVRWCVDNELKMGQDCGRRANGEPKAFRKHLEAFVAEDQPLRRRSRGTKGKQPTTLTTSSNG